MDILARNESAETAIEQITNVVDLQQTHPDQKVLHGVQTNLFDLGEIDVTYDEERKTLWAFMTPNEIPNMSITMLNELRIMLNETGRIFRPNQEKLDYFVMGSRFPGVFNLGGDLHLFTSWIENKNDKKLREYARNCIHSLILNRNSLDMPLVTIALVQGDALGGGFECALSFNVIIAEKGSLFGMPDMIFGLFPGISAHALLTRSLGAAQAGRIIMGTRNYTAEELYDLGIVHVLAEPGQGVETTRDYIAHNSRRAKGQSAAFKAARQVSPLTMDELERIIDIWVDAALQVSPQNLKLMRRIAGAQAKLVSNHVKVAC